MGKADNIVIAAFGEDHVERLTGISQAQLRHWDRIKFYSPSYAGAESGLPFSRVYSFRDVVALRVLNVLRNQHNVPLKHLREVSKKLGRNNQDKWTGVKLWALNRKVVWQEPGTARPQEIVSQQYVVPVVLEVVIGDTLKDVAELNRRDAARVGVIEQSRYIHHNAPIIAGTRIPVAAIRRFHDAGYSIPQILKEYPDLTKRDVEVAIGHGDVMAA